MACLISLLLLVVGLSCTSIQSQSKLERFEFQRPQMGLPFRMVLYAPERGRAERAAEAAFARIAQLNDIMSDYDTDSELSHLSRSSGEGRSVQVSPDLWKVLQRAQDLAERSDGAFDVTVGPYVNLWRRARRTKELPDAEHLAAAARSVGYRQMRLNASTRSVTLLGPAMRLDLGGIAKGYAVDEALKVLGLQGVRSALVSGGGDLAVSDPPPGTTGWRVELAPLDAPGAPPARFVRLKQMALATSGDLFQHLEIAGKRYSHIVDPRTGLGLTDHSLVTVIARDCMTADSLTKVVSVLGPAEGLRFLDHESQVSARVVRKPDAKIEMEESPGFRQFYEQISPLAP